jgi:hypothetical protein
MPHVNLASYCSRPDCPDLGHVVLFAPGGEFDGRTYKRGEPIVFCLRHGGQVYDLIHLMDPRHPLDDARVMTGWLRAAGCVPLVWAPDHIQPSAAASRPWKRPGTPTPPRQRGGR